LFAGSLPVAGSLSQREWNRANGWKQKQVKRTSNKMRLDCGVNLFFHFRFSSKFREALFSGERPF
jgi:hypothetical protein